MHMHVSMRNHRNAATIPFVQVRLTYRTAYSTGRLYTITAHFGHGNLGFESEVATRDHQTWLFQQNCLA